MDTEKRLLRIAVLGAGHWGPNLIRNFHNHQASDVTWVVDRDESRLALTKSRYPEIQVTTDTADTLPTMCRSMPYVIRAVARAT